MHAPGAGDANPAKFIQGNTHSRSFCSMGRSAALVAAAHCSAVVSI